MDNKDNELAKLAGNEGFVSMDRILALQDEAKSGMAGAAKGGANEDSNNSSGHLASQSQAAQPSIEGLQAFNASRKHLGAMERAERGNYLRRVDVERLHAHLAGQSQATKVQAVPVIFDDFPAFNAQAMGCGLEDRGITDLYEAMRYGFEEALDLVDERIKNFLADFAAPTAQDVTQQAAKAEQDSFSPPFAAPAGQHDVDFTSLRLVQNLSTISMRLAADLVSSADYTFQGHDYLDRDAVVDRVMEWRREWDATYPARAELASRCRAQGGANNINGSDLAPTTSTATASGSAQADELRCAVREMTAALEAREWAEHVSRDPDASALESQITELVGLHSASAQASQAAASDEVREKVRDAVAVALDGVYTCGRVWSAWGYGTMSQNDFAPAGEDDDVLGNVVSAVFAALRTNPATPASKGADHA